MNNSDNPWLVAIAMMAATSDGASGPAEQAAIDAVVKRIGSPDISRIAQQLSSGQIHVGDVARQLSDDEARRAAYEAAVAVCHADGATNPAEQAFLEELRAALGLSAADATAIAQAAGAMSDAPTAEVGTGPIPQSATDKALDELILQQAMLTGALEILPDRLANVAILPLQLRLVYQIGQRSGQRLNVNQVKDLAATLGLGAAAQVMEGVVMKVLGGLAGGLLGGLVGGATRVATGAAVTFASTYALGHVAKQYYAQGRSLSKADLKALFARFQEEAKSIFPKVQEQITAQSRTLNLQSVLGGLRG
jgi:tellurite resistance protein/uncharacterized protein (DUF697 family)